MEKCFSFITGDLYWDDGISIDDDLELGSQMMFNCAAQTLASSVNEANFEFDLKMDTIEIWGVTDPVQNVTVTNEQGSQIDCSWSWGDNVLDVDCSQKLLPVLSNWTLHWT